MPFGHIDHTPPILIIKQNPITRKNFCFFRNFFKKTIDKRPKTVYNIYCYLGVAQIGSALPWGGRGRRFKSCHSDQKHCSFKRTTVLFLCSQKACIMPFIICNTNRPGNLTAENRRVHCPNFLSFRKNH